MREPSYYMSGGRLFILVQVTNRPTHNPSICPYHHHHHHHHHYYYYSSSSLLSRRSLSLLQWVLVGTIVGDGGS
jgi:hypothetical protein